MDYLLPTIIETGPTKCPTWIVGFGQRVLKKTAGLETQPVGKPERAHVFFKDGPAHRKSERFLGDHERANASPLMSSSMPRLSCATSCFRPATALFVCKSISALPVWQS